MFISFELCKRIISNERDSSGLTDALLSGWRKYAIDCRAILFFISESGIKTRCFVAGKKPPVQASNKSPILIITVEGIGVAGIHFPALVFIYLKNNSFFKNK